MRYAEFTAPLVKAVQEQQKIIEKMKSDYLILNEKYITSQNNNQKQIEELKTEVENLKTLIYSSSKK